MLRLVSAIASFWQPGFLGALIAGGASLLGGVLANKASAKQASNQMDFQEEMSRTAHQREIKDLQAAGLNPILSGTGGHGATTPAGASAAQSDVITPAVGSAQAARRTEADLKLLKQQEQLTSDNARLARKQAIKVEGESDGTALDGLIAQEELRNRQYTGELMRQQTATEAQRTAQVNADARVATHLGSIYESDAKTAKRRGDLEESGFGKAMGYADRVLDALDKGSSAVRNVTPWGGWGNKTPPPRARPRR